MLKLLVAVLSLLSIHQINAFCKTPADSLVSADEIIREYLHRETKGKFLMSSVWLNEVVFKPERIPGYDSATLIKGFEIELLDSTENVLKYKVIYEQIAVLSQDENGIIVEMNPDFDTVIFEFKLIDSHWLIVSPIKKSHLYPEAIISRLPEKEQEKLKPFLKK